MSGQQTYARGTRAVLLAARDLEEALDTGDVGELPSRANELLLAALARETGGVVSGFRPGAPGTDTGPSEAEPTVDEQLAQVLTEVEIGEVLLAGATALGATDPAMVAGTLGEAVDGLDDADADLLTAGRPALSGFQGGPAPAPEDFFSRLPTTVDGIVARTTGVSRAALRGMSAVPAAQWQPWVTSALSAVPDLGALARAGMRAVTRAVDALTKLVPEDMATQVRAWAKQWWDDHVDSVVDTSVRRALSVSQVTDSIDAFIAAARREAVIPDDRLRSCAERLTEIDARHTRITRRIEKIVNALARLIGPLTVLFAAAASWLYATGAAGLLTAIGVAIWIGRDYLDTGVPLERVPGVRAVLAEAAA